MNLVRKPVFCGKDCGGDACPMLATVEGDRVTRFSHNPAAGRALQPCWRGLHLALSQDSPDRILTPLIRTGPRGSGQFKEAGWEEALSLAAEKLAAIRSDHGPLSILNQASAGCTGALHGTSALLTRFLDFFGGCTRQLYSYSNAAALFILPYVLGSSWMQAGVDAATMKFSRMIILWGANILEARLGTELPFRLLEAKKRGAQVVVIDPRRSATARQAATWWIPCRPGTDSALMLAVLHVLLVEGRVKRDFVETHSVGFPRLERYILGEDEVPPRTPEWAAAITGVPAEEIRQFARMYSESSPAMLLPGYSIQRVHGGEETYRLAVALQLATGNFGIKGGSTGALNNRLTTPRVGTLPVANRSHMPAIPVVRWPDAVLEGRGGGYPADIHAIYTIGGNFLNQGADVGKSIAAFQKSDFNLCHELFLTPTARYCDIILPAASPLEKEDIGIPWAGNYLLYKPQVLSRRGKVRSDYEILWDLADRLGFGDGFSQNHSEAEWIQVFLEQSEIPDHDEFRGSGVYLAPDQERVGLADFSADPRTFPLGTPSGLVEISSRQYQSETGCSPSPIWQQQSEDPRHPMLLITPKAGHRTHSQGSNLPGIQKPGSHALAMNSVDARSRNIQDGDTVVLCNDRGRCKVTVRINNDVMPGVVCLVEGVWAQIDPQGDDVAGSVNMLTATDGTHPGKGCVMHAIPVEVRRTDGIG